MLENIEYRGKSEMIIPRQKRNGEAVTTSKMDPIGGIMVKSELQANKLVEQIRNDLPAKEMKMTFNEKTERKLEDFRKTCKNIPQLDLAYMAGFFDGEGSVIAGRSMRGNHKSPTVFVKIGNTDIRPIQFFHKYFNVTIKKQSIGSNGRTKVFYFVAVGEAKSRIFLEKVFSFLVVKKRQAKLALEFYNKKLEIGNPFRFKDCQRLFEIRDKIASLNDRNHLLSK
jgi:hypothetical protein